MNEQAQQWPSGSLTPVASHLGTDQQTGIRITEILQAEGFGHCLFFFTGQDYQQIQKSA